MSNPKLHDLESMMKAAESESTLMNKEQTQEHVQEKQDSSPEEGKVDPESLKEAINNVNINSVLNQMSADPSKFTKAMEETVGKISPEMIEEAKKLASGGQADKIMREMKRRGIDPNAIRSQIMEQQKLLRGIARQNESTQSVILITSNRQVKARHLPIESLSTAAARLVGESNVVELACSRLANGPLKGKELKIWCNPEHKGKKNQRLTKILGFPISGEGVIIAKDEDLDEESFLVAEKEIIG